MNYEEFRAAGHSLVDYISDYLQHVSTKPLFNPVQPSFLHDLFDEKIPDEPQSLADIQKILEEKLIPYCTHVNHPGYMGLITPSPNPAGILSEFLASALNQNLGAYSIGPSATTMELRVIRWLNDLIGYDENAGGNLTSGGMTSNFIGLKLARDYGTHDVAQHEGMREGWVAYVSEERHVSLDKAADAVGIGRKNLRIIPTNDSYQVRIDLLEKAIKKDKEKGLKPICIIGLAGTTNLGAVDDLVMLSKIAQRENCWLHADAAYGGGMLLSNKNRGLLPGLELADSVTIDPHKWFYAPLDAGAILVKDRHRLNISFGLQPSYLTDQSQQKNERYQFYVNGFEQSKRFRSLKIWVSFHHYGKTKMGEWVDNNISHAKHLHQLAINDPHFESATEPMMSAVCLNYKTPQLTAEENKQLHFAVAEKVESEGKFWFATTIMKGKTWFRINPVNIYTTMEHIDELFKTLQVYCKTEVEKYIQA
ncbi:MAG TPA: pyridoxal-dependent decarboxylase [Chitinophagaceae bacterium]|nr:pyridoxal-dependent decarboxylase [Chitinophagaceae bacterium]